MGIGTYKTFPEPTESELLLSLATFSDIFVSVLEPKEEGRRGKAASGEWMSVSPGDGGGCWVSKPGAAAAGGSACLEGTGIRGGNKRSEL